MEDFNPDEIDNFESHGDMTNRLKGFKEQSVQLIEFKGDKFEINEEALEIIRGIEDEIIVVSVVGKARTGKSYLLNLLLDNIGRKNGVNILIN